MQLLKESVASLAQLHGKTIDVLGYGNQGQAQALNLRDSGVQVIVGNRDDAYRQRAIDDGFAPVSIREAAETMREAGFERVEYIELRDAETLMPSDDPRRPRRMLAAAWVDGVRLIDNIPV